MKPRYAVAAALTGCLVYGGFALSQDRSVTPVPALSDADFYHDGAPSADVVELGRLLFFDPILSGNQNIACATCHHPALATGDGRAMSIGEGGAGLGPDRWTEEGVLGRTPRNAQPLFNLGAREYSTLFHDGRVEPDPTYPSGFWTPAREQLPTGLDNVLAAQAMFPVLSSVEMAGQRGENDVADAVASDRLDGEGGAWDLLADRLREIPEYAEHFENTFDDVHSAADIRFTHAANALAAFQAVAFRSDDSPFDQFLRTGDDTVLSTGQQRGMDLFYGVAGCGVCHSGPLQTDQDFHAIAMPQIGPGKGHGSDTSYWRTAGFPDRLEDEGRYRVSFDLNDLFRFRTPSLRNVTLTGPWGHAGAYDTLEAVVRHHLDPVTALEAYDPDATPIGPLDQIIQRTGVGSQLIWRPVNPARRDDFDLRDTHVQSTPELRGRIAEANELPARQLSDAEVADLLAFLEALTDPAARDLSDLIPDRVPSGLPIDLMTDEEEQLL
ncbi:MAG: cytochrome c peroxidase [Pseudomonadota bacterium]